MTAEASIRYESRGPAAVVTIDRPDRRNAINADVVRGLRDAIRRAEADDEIRALVMTGAGDRAFCAGGDLGGMAVEGGKVAEHLERAALGELFMEMRLSKLPIIARVNGHALGGGFGLMLACDLVVAAASAQIGTPEINVGLWPFIITAVIQRDVPRKVALELMLTGRRLSAEEAAGWGFVNRVSDPGSLDAEVDALVEEVTGKSPLIISLGKAAFYRAEDMDFASSVEYLAGMLNVCLQSEDTVEGVTAFIEKRAPQWKGR